MYGLFYHFVLLVVTDDPVQITYHCEGCFTSNEPTKEGTFDDQVRRQDTKSFTKIISNRVYSGSISQVYGLSL